MGKRELDFTNDVDFVRNFATNKVHVVVPRLPIWKADRDAVALPFAAMADLDLWKTAMLCGFRALVGMTGSPEIDRADFVTTFPDEDLCAACIRAMGDDSWRAFEHPVSDKALLDGVDHG